MSDWRGDGTEFTVAGGLNSISYVLEEITVAGHTVGMLSERMGQLIDTLESEGNWLSRAAVGALPYPYGPLAAVRNAVWIAGRGKEEIANFAHKARRAGENYADVEASNAALIARINRLSALHKGLNTWLLGPLAPLQFIFDAAALSRQPGMGLRDLTEKMLNDGGAYGAGLLGPGAGVLYLLSQLRRQNLGASGVQPAFMLRKAFDGTGLARPGQVAVRAVPVREWDPTDPYYPPGHASYADGVPWKVEASIEGLLAGTSDAYKYPPGSIGVVRIERPDGSNAWIVHLPGTEDWSTIDSKNPFDMEGNLEGLTAAQREAFQQQEVVVQELIKEALRASGALPGDDVLLTGHSGGGIHAAAAAADPAFLAEVNVKMIIIAGSPAKNAAVDKGTSVLDLQNEHDIVTATDFGPPAAAPNWVTATSHRPPSGNGSDLGKVIQEAHAIDNYLKDAATLDQSQDPAVEESREILRTIMGAGGAGAAVAGTKWVYQGRDVNSQPETKAQPKSKPNPTIDRAKKAGMGGSFNTGTRQQPLIPSVGTSIFPSSPSARKQR